MNPEKYPECHWCANNHAPSPARDPADCEAQDRRTNLEVLGILDDRLTVALKAVSVERFYQDCPSDFFSTVMEASEDAGFHTAATLELRDRLPRIERDVALVLGLVASLQKREEAIARRYEEEAALEKAERTMARKAEIEQQRMESEDADDEA